MTPLTIQLFIYWLTVMGVTLIYLIYAIFWTQSTDDIEEKSFRYQTATYILETFAFVDLLILIFVILSI